MAIDKARFSVIFNDRSYSVFFSSRAHQVLGEFGVKAADIETFANEINVAVSAKSGVNEVIEKLHLLAPKLLFALTRSSEVRPPLEECESMAVREAHEIFWICYAAIVYSLVGDPPLEKKTESYAIQTTESLPPGSTGEASSSRQDEKE